MNGIHRARVPATFYVAIAVTIVVGISVYAYFYIQIHEPKKGLAKAQQELKVWTNKSTGFYYCSDSPVYGHTDGGQYMTQQEALQGGYSPALNEPCK